MVKCTFICQLNTHISSLNSVLEQTGHLNIIVFNLFILYLDKRKNTGII